MHDPRASGMPVFSSQVAPTRSWSSAHMGQSGMVQFSPLGVLAPDMYSMNSKLSPRMAFGEGSGSGRAREEREQSATGQV